MKKALLLAEGYLGERAAKTTHGLLRISRRYEIIGVIDSTFPGKTTEGLVEGGKTVPVYPSIKECPDVEYLIIGVAPAGGRLPDNMREQVMAALRSGINVISGLHEFLSEDRGFRALAEKSGAKIVDIRKSPPLNELSPFSNLMKSVDVPRIPILGTDSSIGKRTTAWYLRNALIKEGVKAVIVATGQTGILQGADYGIPLDAIQGDYMVGALEHEIYRAYQDGAEAIVIEGQGALSHPVYVCGSRAILSASKPEFVFLQHAPGRRERGYHREELHLLMPEISHEIGLIRNFSGADVAAITINHEGLSRKEVEDVKEKYRSDFGVPAFDPLWDGMKVGVDVVKERLG